ncbi:four helix bundle protein [Candidatus Wolfebacteria bacterium]|nr:four helix bundle protein [Candidatus Wolfebacteria bacterium]
MLKSYKDLTVWQRAIELVEEVYTLTKALPKEEMYNLMSQMRRSSVSIPSNIAEGYKRRGLGEYLQFLSIADASAAELETQITIMRKQYPDLGCTHAERLIEEVQKMLFVLIKKLSSKP